jgi:hypothetical protein
MDRASGARARVEVILSGSRVQMLAVRYRFEALPIAVPLWRGSTASVGKRKCDWGVLAASG